MVTVHLLRHGEVHNPDGVLYGRMPGFRLSELGARQAVAAAEFLAKRPLGYLVSSPLERAQQTAVPLAELTGLPALLDERLIEAENRLEGRAVAGGRGLFADPGNWPLFRNPFRPSWGEPYVDIAARMRLAMRAARAGAAAAGDGLEAACISHQLPIVIARRDAQGEHLFHDPRHRQCALGSVTSFTFDADLVVDISYTEPAAELPAGHGAGA